MAKLHFFVEALPLSPSLHLEHPSSPFPRPPLPPEIERLAVWLPDAFAHAGFIFLDCFDFQFMPVSGTFRSFL